MLENLNANKKNPSPSIKSQKSSKLKDQNFSKFTHKPPDDLNLIFEKLSLKTFFFIDFEHDFYCLCT